MAADISPRSGSSDALSAPPAVKPMGTDAGGVRVAWPHVVLSVLGLGASAYATYAHFLIEAGKATGCSVSETISCDAVIGSSYGVVFGIPLGIFGAAFWAIVLITAISGKGVSPRAAALQRLAVGTVGLLTSLVLAYISLGVLHKLCLVCATTHILSGINFLVAAFGAWKLRSVTAVAPQ